MGRQRKGSVGMPKAKKKKVAALDSEQAAMAAPIRAAAARHAPPKPLHVDQPAAVAPPSPMAQDCLDTLDLVASANLYLKAANQQLRKDERNFELQGRIFDAQSAAIERSFKRGKTAHYKLDKKIDKACDQLCWTSRGRCW